jgi:GTP-binding protein Era
MEENTFKSGFVAIVGPPNAGKSTLLNKLLGEKIAIISPKPQTTRNRILGILHGKGFQLAFLDTPGIHKTKTLLHKSMVSSASELFNEVDILLVLVDATSYNDEEISLILNNIKKSRCPVILAINKIDRIPRIKILPIIEYFIKKHDFQSIVPVSALTGDGIDNLLNELKKLIRPGPEFYPKDMTTD